MTFKAEIQDLTRRVEVGKQIIEETAAISAPWSIRA